MKQKGLFDKESLLSNKKSEIAELLGILIGDGHLHKTENRLVISGSLDDFDYYVYYIIPLFDKLFNDFPKLIKNKYKHSYHLVIENKEIFDFFHKELQLKRGRKLFK